MRGKYAAYAQGSLPSQPDNRDDLRVALEKNILLFSIPLVLTQLLEVLFNLSDVAVAGKFADYRALGAVGSTTQLVTLFTGFLIGLGSGVNIEVARSLGAEDRERTEKNIHTSFIICAAAGVLLCLICCVFARDILVLLRTKDELLEGAVLYFSIYALGMQAMAVYNFGNGSAERSRGHEKTAAVPDDIRHTERDTEPVLRHKVPYGSRRRRYRERHSAGAVGGDDNGAPLPPGRRLPPVPLKAPLQRPERKACADARNPDGASERYICGGKHVRADGREHLRRGHGLRKLRVGQCRRTDIQHAGCVLTACSSFISRNWGAGRKERILKSYIASLTYAFAAGAICGVLLLCFGREFLSIFANEQAVIDAGMQRIKIMGFSYGICAFMDCSIAAARGLGKSIVPMIIVVLGSCVFRVVWIYTVFAFYKTIPSLYLLYFFSWAITGAAETLYFRKVYKQCMAGTRA